MPYEVGALLCYLKGLKITTPNTSKSSNLSYTFIGIFYKIFMYRLITTTTDSRKNAKLIIDKILSDKLSPCVQLLNNVESFYRWEGEIENNLEYLILIKCKPENEELVKSAILEVHTYEVPEIISSDFNILNPDYDKWFLDNSI